MMASLSSFFDAIMVFASGFPYMVNRVENLSIPLTGVCIQVCHVMFNATRETVLINFFFSSTRPSS